MTITFLPQPDVIQRGKGGVTRLMKKRPTKWNGWVARRFLRTLASTCNVSRSAAAAGVTHTTVYDRRRSDSAFAARWEAALARGHAELEMALLRGAIAAMEGEPVEPDSPLPPVTVSEAIMLLRYHDRSVGRPGKAMGRAAPRPDTEKLRESILRKVMAIRRHRLKELEAAMVRLGPLP